MRALLLVFISSILALHAEESGELQYELRMAVTHSGYSHLFNALGLESVTSTTRKDFYFDFYDGKKFIFRSNPKLPLKIRVKSYDSGDYVWQISKRTKRLSIGGASLPITLTELISFESALKRSHGKALTKKSEKFTWALRRDKEDIAGLALTEIHRRIEMIGELPGNSLIKPKHSEKNIFIPIYINEKHRLKSESEIVPGLRLSIQLRKITYWLSPSVGWHFYELEAEPLQNSTEEEMQKAGIALEEFLKTKGEFKPEYLEGIPIVDHCALTLSKLGSSCSLKAPSKS